MNVRRRALTLLFCSLALAESVADASAPPGRYTIAQGTQTDLRTNLTWQQTGPGRLDWTAATSYCASLDLNGTGWRLPTAKELVTLEDWSSTRSGQGYWSSTPDIADPNSALGAPIPVGQMGSLPKTTAVGVRCVR
jgi:hypothetical protein